MTSPTVPVRVRVDSVPEDDMDVGEGSQEKKQVIVGICAMAKKAQSKYMKEILDRLERFEYLRTMIFEEETILKRPVEEWPLCHALIAFYSKGFPLAKAVDYAKLRDPFLINDLEMQYRLMDRREVYRILRDNNINTPNYVVLNRDSDKVEEHGALVETDDQIEVNGVVFQKPFVEKPVSAEDHNIYIYFPTSAGGGSQRLFRKIACRSSVYSSVNKVRRVGSYIYEQFMPTDGTDVKVYTLGAEYAHAEARKAPALDGKVERDRDGKEVRFPVILSAREKMIASLVSSVFKQAVCGFDLLRANNNSYVCDVNGFSFVKTSQKYYDDCAKIIGNMILRQLAPSVLHFPWSLTTHQPEVLPVAPTTFGRMMELRCVVGVIRHGDRTPKQKMKMVANHEAFLKLYQKYARPDKEEIKLKQPKQLQEVLDIARDLLLLLRTDRASEVKEDKVKLEQVKLVLEMYGRFMGINRKVQMRLRSDDKTLLFVLKWGGELTQAGKKQALELGKTFRYMYPGGQGEYSIPGLGLLRLHSTFRHDLKIYSSEEGRVQMTAAAFAKGFLALEGEIAPILVQMVKSANTQGLLDIKNTDRESESTMKNILQRVLNQDCDVDEEMIQTLCPTGSKSMLSALAFIENPRRTCEAIHEMIHELVKLVKEKALTERHSILYHKEDWELMIRRWAKLDKDFFNGTDYQISKIPDIYDCIKYDWQYNQQTLLFPHCDKLYHISKAMADIVVPQEYGMNSEDKFAMAKEICRPLLNKILVDLTTSVSSGTDEDHVESSTFLDIKRSRGIMTPHRRVRTRLYFTSESHLHSLLSVLEYGNFMDPLKEPDDDVFKSQDKQWERALEYLSSISEINYISQVVIMLYEDTSKPVNSDDRFHVELHFSPGAYNMERDNIAGIGGFRSNYRTQPTPLETAAASKSATASGAVEQPPKSLPLENKEGVSLYSLLTASHRTTLVVPAENMSPHRCKNPEDIMRDRVPVIKPLETMHNKLTLKELTRFLASITGPRCSRAMSDASGTGCHLVEFLSSITGPLQDESGSNTDQTAEYNSWMRWSEQASPSSSLSPSSATTPFPPPL